jgi:cytochrome c oxidase subunit 2
VPASPPLADPVHTIPATLGRPAPSLTPRQAFGLALLAAVAGLLLSAAIAPADLLTPEDGGSPNADKIDRLYKLTLAVATIVFVGVEGALFYSLLKFRARKGAVPAQIRGNTRLEIGWTVGAAVILVLLAIFTFAELDGIRTPDNTGANGLQIASATPAGPLTAASKRFPPNGKALTICVNGQQYVWRFTYTTNGKCQRNDLPLDSPFSYQEMVVPTDTTVLLEIQAQDVAHSWWIPKLGGKFDAIPGYTNNTWFKIPSKLDGTVFTGQCAELCGRNHANMTARVRAVAPDQFESFLEQRKADIDAANKGAQEGRRKLERDQAAGGGSN